MKKQQQQQTAPVASLTPRPTRRPGDGTARRTHRRRGQRVVRVFH